MNQVKEIVFVECDIAHVKRSNPEKNPRRYPEQKREKEWTPAARGGWTLE